jgi:glycerol-3-phosphate O-acyltransferase
MKKPPLVKSDSLDEVKSHPAIRFEHVPTNPGKMFEFKSLRSQILGDVVEKTAGEFKGAQLDLLLGEALYAERQRLKREKKSAFTKKRSQGDRALWNTVQAGLLQGPALADRNELLKKVVSHYAEEIGGHFNPKIYEFAIQAVPWGFSWLLNAASVKRFLPWGMTESLESRLHILGEVHHLQKLAQKGTILLVPTHQSNIDSVLIGYVISLMSLPPFAYGAGLNLFSNPALSFFMSNLGAYTVDRQKRNEVYKTTLKNYSTRILREGIHSIFFPGGGRSRSGAIENHLKLGLMGTALEAQIQKTLAGDPKPNVYVVPMVMSYHFVVEASSLVEDYLAEAGKHRFIITDDESWQPSKVAHFFWKLFSSQSGITVRIGKPMDVFGNFVDEEGRSIGPNGTVVDPKRWLTTNGKIEALAQRDREYTRELGVRLIDRFHKENTVLTSHLVAFAFFEALRRKYPELDLYRFLRLSLAQRTMSIADFEADALHFHRALVKLEKDGALHLCDELRRLPAEKWIDDGVRQLGLLHEHPVVKVRDGVIWTEDMNLLYYYRNRLCGYGLSIRSLGGVDGGSSLDMLRGVPGEYDRKGFLA